MTVLRGVNLGGWLVAERWMTPELFAGSGASDEYGLRADLESPMKERLQKHRREFVTRRDIQDIKKAGFDIVRVPVGYWLWQKVEGYLEAPDVVDDLLDWCHEVGLGVILSLHGAPGSQNGWDHSGRVGEVKWPSKMNVLRTLDVIEHIATQYGHHKALIGISVLNEPHPSVSLNTLVEYYLLAASLVRKRAAPAVQVILSDAFRPIEMVQALKGAGLDDYILDVHLYQTFDAADKERSFDEHINKVEVDWRELLSQLGEQTKVFVGEWSAMLAAETFAGLSDQTRRGMVERYYDAQQHVFNQTVWGWAYWSYKTGGSSVWNWSAHDGLWLH